MKVTECCHEIQNEEYPDLCPQCGDKAIFIPEECAVCPCQSGTFCTDFEKEIDDVTECSMKNQGLMNKEI